jgi:hypothetical protein
MTLLHLFIGQWISNQTVTAEQGTAKASLGAIERLSEPDFLDIISPFFAFTIVIVMPSIIALWVIFKTLTQKSGAEEDTLEDVSDPTSPSTP